jgi:hypothetical protein
VSDSVPLLTYKQPVRAHTPVPRILQVVIVEGRWFDIYDGESMCRQLGWDEFLGAIAVITHPSLSKLSPRVPAYAGLIHVDELLSYTGFRELCPKAKDPEPPLSWAKPVKSEREAMHEAEREIRKRANAWRTLNGLSLEDEEIPF